MGEMTLAASRSRHVRRLGCDGGMIPVMGPRCAQCGTAMALERIEPHPLPRRGLLQVFQCAACHLVESVCGYAPAGAS